jgi:methylphosphotriester-DNA--protein-cysteine methyltransferase
MTLTKEEAEALRNYFDETSINITKLIKKIGLKQTKKFEEVIDKIYKETL